MKLFKRNAKEKESNIATSPESSKTYVKRITLAKVLFFIWNILSIGLYCSYTLFISYKLSEKSFLSKIIVYLLILYAVSFVILLILGLFSKKKMKYHLKNYKSAVKFLKYAIQIINFSLSIVTAISALITTGTTDVSAILFAVLSLVITLIFILFEIAKIIIRKNIPLIKYNLLEMRDKGYDQKNRDSKN